jgi:DNA-binding Xre family transcriptional regulator
MIKINIDKLLKENKKSKYWLCQQMNITSRNLNRIIRGETTSISFKYIEEFCTLLKCYPNDLFTITKYDEEKIELKQY